MTNKHIGSSFDEFLKEEKEVSEKIKYVDDVRAEIKSVSQQVISLKEKPKLDDDAKAKTFKDNLKDAKSGELKTGNIKTELDAGAKRLEALKETTKIFAEKVSVANEQTLPVLQTKLDELHEEIKKEAEDLQKRAQACRDVIVPAHDDKSEGAPSRPALPAEQNALLDQAEKISEDAKKESEQAEKAKADAETKKASAPGLDSSASSARP